MPELTAGTGIDVTEDNDDLIVAVTGAVMQQQQPVTVESGATYTLDADDIGVQLILTDSSPELTVPNDEDVAWPIGCWVEVFGPNGPITIVEDTSVTVGPRTSQTLVTEEAGAGFMLKKYAAQTWMCVGAMAAS